MRYRSVIEIAKKWNISERSVRNYCAQGRVNGAFLTGKTWKIPENVEKPNPLYEEIADITLPTDEQNAKVMVNQIVDLIDNLNGLNGSL